MGGLVGLNRTMRLDALLAGVRNGAVNNIMVPRDIVANAPRIISDLRAIFLPQKGTFLIGPMAKLGWGTPTLVSISLGVIIEILGNIAIFGVLRVALPVSIVGAIEFDRQRLFFFASLLDSRILFITLDGDMGLLAAFGEDANFVLSIGGFHPRFTPPPEDVALVLHPAGTLQVAQKLAPFDVPISRLGNRRARDGRRFSLSVAPGGLSKSRDVKESFAAAQFNDLTDATRLSAPAFEPLNGGIELTLAGRSSFAAAAVERANRYKLLTIDTAGSPPLKKLRGLEVVFSRRILAGAAVA